MMVRSNAERPSSLQIFSPPVRRALGAASGVALIALWGGETRATAAGPYAAMAPLERYEIADARDEIALAKSAAPASIATNADVLTLGADGYHTAVKGSNGFVCVVERSWADDFTDPEFWNPKSRSPLCFNPASARSVLPTYLMRTRWVLAHLSLPEMTARTKAAIADKSIIPPEIGSMCFMLSKDGYLGDAAGGHWRPHVMFWLPRTDVLTWGANASGSPVMGQADGVEPFTVFFVPVPAWSDGTPAAESAPMKM